MSDWELSVRRLANDPELLAACIAHTARQTGFRPELVEKDFWCSRVLQVVARSAGPNVVFKGGTCLSKVFAGFYRLSEDLDFVLPVPQDCPRARRRELIAPVKVACAQLPARCPGLNTAEALRGYNGSAQYIGNLAYASLISHRQEPLKVEFGLREPLLTAAQERDAATLLINPVTGKKAVPLFTVRVMSLPEALAEKVRAALTRREPAIRDFFDLDFALSRLALKLEDPAFIGLVRQKLAVPGNEPADLSSGRRQALGRQVETELKPVLRPADFAAFSLDRILAALLTLAEHLELS